MTSHLRVAPLWRGLAFWLASALMTASPLVARAQTETASSGDPAPTPASSAATPVAPSKRWISVGVGSYHLQDASQYNQQNPGLGIEWPISNPWAPELDTRVAVGFFRNSERAQSTYVGAFVFPWELPRYRLKAGALVGIINGYARANNGGFFPLLVPTLAYESGNLGANLFLVPPVAGIPATLALQVKVGF